MKIIQYYSILFNRVLTCQAEWPRAYLPTAASKSERLQQEDSPASADLPNLGEWRRAYPAVAERNLQRARPILRTRKGTSDKHYKTK